MRIALDARPLQDASGGRGVGRYVRSLVAAMRLRDGEELLLLESAWRGHSGIPDGAMRRRVRLARPARAITLFDQIATPLFLSRERVDVFHATFFALPVCCPRRTRTVLTVHDLIPLIVPGAASWKNTAIFRASYRSALRADAVIVPSARTARDLEERIRVPHDRIHLIPLGAGPPFSLVDREPLSPELRGAPGRIFPGRADPSGMAPSGTHPAGSMDPGGPVMDVGALFKAWRDRGFRVLFYAGGFDPAKNVPFLFRALALVRDPLAVLFVAGDAGSAHGQLLAEVSRAGAEGRVFWLGRLSEAALAAAYRAADLFVSSSLYEGFGLPPLEAMACGCPVVALSAGTVPEVLGGGAAVGVEESTPEAFAAAVGSVLRSDAVRMDLIARGLVRARELTWERTAEATLDLYRALTGGALGGEDAGALTGGLAGANR